jgi:peptidyl-prolyl cis-trans isomerase D
MLRFLSQRSGLRKTVLLSIVAILVLSLGIVFALPSGRTYLSTFVPIENSTVVASVDGYPITLSELRNQLKVYGMSQQFQGGQMQDAPDADSLYPQYGKQAIDTLVTARIVRREADRLGVGATRKEMQDRITSMFVGRDGKWVGEQEYITRLRLQGLTVEDFERDIADGITEEKLRNFLTSGLTVSDREVEEDYRRQNTTMKPTYALVAPKPGEVPAPTDEELRAHYEARRAEFRINETQRKVAYVFVDQEALARTIAVSDEELRQDYDPKKYVSAVKLAQIVFKVPAPDKDADIRKKAEDVAARARGGGDKPPEDFAELARQNSEDAATAAAGGDAGFVEKASLKPGDPRERLFTLEPGQTSSALKVDNNYVVYKVLERREKSFEEAREELLTAARQRNAYSRGVELAQQAEQKLRESKNPQQVASELNATLGAPAVSVRETGFLQPGDSIPDIGTNAQFDAEVADLKETGDVGGTVGITGGFAVPMLAEKREPHDASFEEVRDRVAAAWRQERARQRAREVADQLAQAATPDDLIARARALGLDPKTQENYKAGGTLPDLQASDLLDSSLIALAANSVSKTPVELPAGWVVLASGERTEPDMGEAYNSQKESIRERLLATKQGQLYSEYVKNVRKQLEDAELIAIYQDTIDRAFSLDLDLGLDDEDAPAPSLPPVGSPRSTPVTPARPPAPVPTK